MYIGELNLEGYKGIRGPSSLNLHEGLNVIVGENSSGKTTVIDSIRLLLKENEFGLSRVEDTDFHTPFDPTQKVSKCISIRARFDRLSDKQKIAFLPWLDHNENALLSLQIEENPNRNSYKRSIWGGVSRVSIFEWELFDEINCVYLPPLRDAEAKLKEGKSSRLARLLKKLESKKIKEAEANNEVHKLQKDFFDFNESISSDPNGAIHLANQKIGARLRKAIGATFGQSTQIQFSETNFNRIVESLRLFFYPKIDAPNESGQYRSLSENSLGYNNLLYLATVLAELVDTPQESDVFKILLIEEPEAHLHPQLQVRLLKYLESVAFDQNVQVIVTTHSPTLASSVSIKNLIHLSTIEGNLNGISVRKTGIVEAEVEQFLSRWLDVTKSTLLFAKGVILVEGIAEVFLVPELAKLLLNESDKNEDFSEQLSLGDFGVTIVNMNGIYFRQFMQLFCELTGMGSAHEDLPIRCSGITDLDPPKEENGEAIRPHPLKKHSGENKALELVSKINESRYARLYHGELKTLEYDLAFEGNNIKKMSQVLYDNWPKDGSVKSMLRGYISKDWRTKGDGGEQMKEFETKAEACFYLLSHIDDTENMGKGRYSQLLAQEIGKDSDFSIPSYIKNAILWACGIDEEQNRKS